MKLSKLLLTGAVMAAAIGFMSCTQEDDPYGLINEVNSDYYTIDATNTEPTIIRGYRSTNLKHAGAIVKVSFSKKEAGPNGVMGVIFGLHDGANGKDFGIIGLRDNGTYYVSGLRNVQDLQAPNFGATANETNYNNAAYTEPVELEVKGLESTFTGKQTEDGFSVYVYYRDTVAATANSDGSYDHTYEVYIIDNATDDYVAKDDGKVYVSNENGAAEANLGSPVATIAYKDANSSVTQYQFAPYANIYPTAENAPADFTGTKGKGSLKGSWIVQGTYKEANVVEE